MKGESIALFYFFYRPMTKREKSFILIASLYALNRRNEVPAILHRMKVPHRHLVELFLHLSLLLGFPAMLDGYEKLSSLNLLPRSSQHRLAFHNNRTRGLRALRRVYGSQTDKLLSSLEAMFPGLSTMIVEDVYGKVIARRGLTLRERELVNIAVLTIQGLNRQLHSHVRGAIRVGVSPTTLRSALRLLGKRFRVRTRVAEELLSQLT